MNKTHYIIAFSLTVFSILLYLAIKKADLKPLYIILVGAGLAVVAAAFTAWGTFLQNERSSNNNAEIKETGEKTYANSNLQLESINNLKNQNFQLTLDLKKRDEKVEKQSEKIIELNEKLVEKSEYISDHLTGGTGFPIISTSTIKPQNPQHDAKQTFTLMNENKLPLYDIVVNVMDWNYLESKFVQSDNPNKPYLSQSDFKKSMLYIFEENQMFPQSSIISKDIFDLRDALLYVKLKSRSSFVFQKIAFVTHNNMIYKGFIIYNETGILKEWINEGAPEFVKTAIRKKFDRIPNTVGFTFTD